MNNTGKIVAAVAAGVAAGAILGVLFAPGKGSDTRKKIVDNMQDKFDKCKEKFSDLKEQVEETIKEKAKEFS